MGWIRKQHSNQFDLGHGLTLSVFWSVSREDHDAGTPYVATALGNRLKTKFATEQAATNYLERYAAKVLSEAITKLSTPEPAREE